jgi:hypothetical protein
MKSALFRALALFFAAGGKYGPFQGHKIVFRRMTEMKYEK